MSSSQIMVSSPKSISGMGKVFKLIVSDDLQLKFETVIIYVPSEDKYLFSFENSSFHL